MSAQANPRSLPADVQKWIQSGTINLGDARDNVGAANRKIQPGERLGVSTKPFRVSKNQKVHYFGADVGAPHPLVVEYEHSMRLNEVAQRYHTKSVIELAQDPSIRVASRSHASSASGDEPQLTKLKGRVRNHLFVSSVFLSNSISEVSFDKRSVRHLLSRLRVNDNRQEWLVSHAISGHKAASSISAISVDPAGRLFGPMLSNPKNNVDASQAESPQTDIDIPRTRDLRVFGAGLVSVLVGTLVGTGGFVFSFDVVAVLGGLGAAFGFALVGLALHEGEREHA